jgi:hypothetical protein
MYHLIDLARQPGITIHVLPFRTDWHPAVYGRFCVLWFPDPAIPTWSTARP